MTQADRSTEARVAEVRARLDLVADPELDEAVTELGFVTAIDVGTDGVVTIGFRLPTYWCAANFAFMMADDMRREVSALPWVTRIELTLDDHMYGEQINRAMSSGMSFRQTFGVDAEGGLDNLRRTFLVKAFQRRQEALLRHLLDRGLTADRLIGLTVAALRALALDLEGRRLADRYLERRGVVAADGAADLAFVDADGATLGQRDIAAYLQALRRIGINAEFNGALCRGLLAARYGDGPATLPVEPTLVDFIRAGPGPAPAHPTT